MPQNVTYFTAKLSQKYHQIFDDKISDESSHSASKMWEVLSLVAFFSQKELTTLLAESNLCKLWEKANGTVVVGCREWM